ncbi:MAG: 3-hydroxyacyl-CoA dehydrogenase family protein [Haloarculaceae archaeon]
MDVAVLGAGRLGRAVAQVCAVAGHDVHFYDDDANDVMDGIDAIEGRLPAETAAVDRLSGTTGLEAAVGDADVVVETTTTDATTLQADFADIEADVDRETLIVPGAVGVSVTAAAAGLRHPDRAIGLQFCDPLDTPLVEVVVADQTSQETCDRARSFVEGLDRSPVVVRDAPGVVSTRATLALEAEAMRLVDDGVAGVEAVDDVLELGFDHASGPLAQADRAGLGNRLETLETLHAELGDRFEPPGILRDLVAAGKTGGPSGEGFYVWENGEPTEPALPSPDIPRRESIPDDPAEE